MYLVEKLGKNFRVSIVGQVQSFMEWWGKQQSSPQPACSTHACATAAVKNTAHFVRSEEECTQDATRLSEKEEKGRKGGKKNTEQ